MSMKNGSEKKASAGMDFESALTELEKVVQQLDGELKLEAALDLFERGMELSKECETFLKGAKQKVEMLKKNADGSVESVPFDTRSDQEENEELLDNESSSLKSVEQGGQLSLDF